MEILARGTLLETDETSVPGTRDDAPIAIERGLGECPHGFWYEARREDEPLLVTILDPIVVAQPNLRVALQRDIDHGRYVSHRNLLPCYGLATAGLRVFTVEAWPGGSTVRQFARERRERNLGLDKEGAYTLCAHICNGLIALHDQLVHGYVTADTVHVSEEGRVLIGAMGIGRTLAQTRGFSRFRSGGLLPNIAPEQVLSPPQVMPSTDVFGVATLFVELITGQSLVEAGQPVRDVGVAGPPALVECLERATRPEPGDRYPDIATFKAALRQALRSEGVRTVTRPPGELDAAFRAELATPPPIPVDDGFDDWTDLAVPEDSGNVQLPDDRLSDAVPPPPSYSGAPPVPSALSPELLGPGDDAAGPPYPPPPEGAPPGYPYPPPPEGAPPGYPYPAPPEGAPPGYPYPPPPEGAPPGYPYPPPGYAYPPPGYGYPPPPAGYPYPPAGYPYPPPGYPYPPPGGGGYPPTASPGAGPHPVLGAAATAVGDAGSTQLDLDELDRATRRIADVDANSALREFTENVGAGDARFSLEGEEGAPVEEVKANTSLLGLEVGEFEETAQRLATLDGVEEDSPSGGPSKSGTFFSNFSDDPVDGPPDDELRFHVLRDGNEYGPYPLASLLEMIAAGRVRSVDTLRNEATGKEILVVDVPQLRRACDERRERTKPTPQPAQIERTPAARPAPTGSGKRSPAVPLLVVASVAVAGVAGWFFLAG